MQHVQLHRVLLLLLVFCCYKLNSTCSLGWSCSLLVVDNGIVFHFGKCLFHCMGRHSPWRTSPWRGYPRGNFISYLPLEFWLLSTPNYFQVNFWLLSTPNSFQVNFWLFVPPNSFEVNFWIVRPTPNLSRITFGSFVQPQIFR